MRFAEAFLTLLAIYAGCGAAFGIGFVFFRGVERVDLAARGASIGFRLLILPGTVALWPLMATKWFRARRDGGIV